MSTISKERLEQLASGNAWVCVQDDEAAELARIALASLEAGPVAITDYMAYAFHNALSDSSLGADEVEEIKDGLRAAFANVTAPPAPVSVPAAMEMDDDFDSAFEHGKAVGWNAYRAAMLQGAEPVTTAYKLPFEQWLSQQSGTIDVECGCVMTEVFFHWLRVAYEDGKSPVIADGWVACSERMPEDEQEVIVQNKMGYRYVSYFDEHSGLFFDMRGGNQMNCIEHIFVTHWMPLPAAPQQ